MFAGRRTLVILALACLLGLGVGAVAIAQQSPRGVERNVVIVHVVLDGHPAAGRVTVRDEDGHETSCEANETGECEIQGLTPGRHVVQVSAPDGTNSRARAVMIPEDGKVSLIVQLPPPNAQDASP